MGVGVTGIHTGVSMLEKSGHQIASANIPTPQGETKSIAEPVAGLMEAKHQVQASARVVEAGSDVLGTLLDIKA